MRKNLLRSFLFVCFIENWESKQNHNIHVYMITEDYKKLQEKYIDVYHERAWNCMDTVLSLSLTMRHFRVSYLPIIFLIIFSSW